MTTAQELDQRYGRTPRGKAGWIIGIVIAAIVVVIAGWMTVSQSMSSVDADDLGFEVVDEYRVNVLFQVAGVQGKDVVCALEALDEEFGVVGWKIVEIPAVENHIHQLSAIVPTVAEATTGLVNTCWLA